MPSEQPRPIKRYMENGVDYSWHFSKEFNSRVKAFHENNARQPENSAKEVKSSAVSHDDVIKELRSLLKTIGMCAEVEYVGSSYEGVKVGRSVDGHALEYDVMMMIEQDGNLTKVELPSKAGYRLLKPGNEEAMKFFREKEWLDDKGYISSSKVVSKFKGKIQSCFHETNSSKRLPAEDCTTIREHGPAVQIDVYESPKKAKLIYSIDIVPTFVYSENGGEKEYYVGKPIKDGELDLKMSWRRSYSLDEKKMLRDADGDNGCRKKVLRILKTIRDREPGLRTLTSYHLKSVTLHMVKKNNKDWWKEENIGVCLMECMKELIRMLTDVRIPNFFLPEVNLLEEMNTKTIENIRNRFQRMRNSEKEMNGVLTGACRPRRKSSKNQVLKNTPMSS